VQVSVPRLLVMALPRAPRLAYRVLVLLLEIASSIRLWNFYRIALGVCGLVRDRVGATRWQRNPQRRSGIGGRPRPWSCYAERGWLLHDP
jgi:hypothetical protein